MTRCKHEWGIRLGLRSFPAQKNPVGARDGVMEYIAVCKKCDEHADLKPEIVQLIFKNGGLDE